MLVAISGGISCGKQHALTNFGCLWKGGTWLGVFVTNETGSDGVIVPQEESKTHTHGEAWYKMDGFDSNSPFVEFDLPESGDEGYCFEQGTEYNLWMGEAMLQQGDDNNPEDNAYTDIFICSDTKTTTTTTASPNTSSSPVNEIPPGYEGCYKGLDNAKQRFDNSSGLGSSRNSPLK